MRGIIFIRWSQLTPTSLPNGIAATQMLDPWCAELLVTRRGDVRSLYTRRQASITTTVRVVEDPQEPGVQCSTQPADKRSRPKKVVWRDFVPPNHLFWPAAFPREHAMASVAAKGYDYSWVELYSSSASFDLLAASSSAVLASATLPVMNCSIAASIARRVCKNVPNTAP